MHSPILRNETLLYLIRTPTHTPFPGGNLGFEDAAFKLSYEMTELLDPGRTRQSAPFLTFQELCVKAYLVARSCAGSIVASVAMMEPSELPCFRKDSLPALRDRFKLELNNAEAAAHMRALVERAYDRWTTGFYDYIQYLQNDIPK